MYFPCRIVHLSNLGYYSATLFLQNKGCCQSALLVSTLILTQILTSPSPQTNPYFSINVSCKNLLSGVPCRQTTVPPNNMGTNRMLRSRLAQKQMCPPNLGHHGESTQYKMIQTKYVFKTSFDGRSGLFQTTLISHCLTSLLPKPTLILAKSLTSDPYNRGFLFRRKSVVLLILACDK